RAAVLLRDVRGAARPVEVDREVVLALARAVLEPELERPEHAVADLEDALLDERPGAQEPREAARLRRRAEPVAVAVAAQRVDAFADAATLVLDVVGGRIGRDDLVRAGRDHGREEGGAGRRARRGDRSRDRLRPSHDSSSTTTGPARGSPSSTTLSP